MPDVVDVPGPTVDVVDVVLTRVQSVTTGGMPVAVGTPVVKGDPGIGVPVGGAAGQALVKTSTADYDTEWATPSAGGVTSVNGATGAVTVPPEFLSIGSTAPDTTGWPVNGFWYDTSTET